MDGPLKKDENLYFKKLANLKQTFPNAIQSDFKYFNYFMDFSPQCKIICKVIAIIIK